MESDDSMRIKVVTWIIVNGSGVCRQVPLTVQSIDLTNDFVILETGALM